MTRVIYFVGVKNSYQVFLESSLQLNKTQRYSKYVDAVQSLYSGVKGITLPMIQTNDPTQNSMFKVEDVFHL